MSEALTLFKALGDGTRIKILDLLSKKECYVDMLSDELGLTPATVSFHIKKLLVAGIVKARRERYYTMYSLNKEALDVNIAALLFSDKTGTDAGVVGADSISARSPEQAFRDKVIKAFMPCGYCETLPVNLRKRRVIFEEIFKLFEPGKSYQESEVNDIISPVHGDYCMIRRSFIELGWMTRDKGVYTIRQDKL